MKVKRFFKGTASTIAIIVVATGSVFGLGYIGLKYKQTFGMAHANVDREIFKENKSHVEGMASDLANYKFEYETSDDEKAKKAIISLIRTKYANFDIDKLESTDLQLFLMNIKNGSIK